MVNEDAGGADPSGQLAGAVLDARFLQEPLSADDEFSPGAISCRWSSPADLALRPDSPPR